MCILKYDLATVIGGLWSCASNDDFVQLLVSDGLPDEPEAAAQQYTYTPNRRDAGTVGGGGIFSFQFSAKRAGTRQFSWPRRCGGCESGMDARALACHTCDAVCALHLLWRVTMIRRNGAALRVWTPLGTHAVGN